MSRKARDEAYADALKAINRLESYGDPAEALDALDELMAEIRVRIEALREDLEREGADDD